MTPAATLLAEVRALGVEVIPTDRGTLRVRPVWLTPALTDALRQHKPEIIRLLASEPPILPAEEPSATLSEESSAPIRHVLARLWLLNIPPASRAVDVVAEARHLLTELARLCDELGPEFAAAVSRAHAHHWARTMGRCPWCGLAGVFHDGRTQGEESVLEETSQ